MSPATTTTASIREKRGAGLLFLAVIMVAVVADTRFNPVGGILRLLVAALLPVLMVSFQNVGQTARAPTGPTFAMVLIILFGAFSSVASVTPILGFMKLGFFVAVVIPLVNSRAIQEAFWPGTKAYWRFSKCLDLLLVLTVVQALGVFGFMDNPNKLAAMALVGLPWKLIQTTSRRRSERTVAWAWVLLLFCVCVLVHSRGALGGFLIMVLVFRFSGPGRSMIAPIILGGLLIVGLSVAVEMIPELKEYAYKDREAFLDDRRQAMVDATMDGFRERPLLGYGFGLSWNVRPEHVEAVLRTGRLSWFVGEFGNSTFAILAGGGALLLGAFGLYFALLIRHIETSFRTVCRSGTEAAMQRAMFGGIMGMLAYSQVEGWMLSPLNWITVFFWLFVGMAIRLAAGPVLQLPLPSTGDTPRPGALLAEAHRLATLAQEEVENAPKQTPKHPTYEADTARPEER